jgi:hypothetical protein
MNLFKHSISFPSEEDDAAIVARLGLEPIVMHDHVFGKDLALKAPQRLAIYHGQIQPRFILSLDKGMGKTLTYLLLARLSGADRVIILCTRNAMSTQRSHIKRFFPEWADSFAFITGQAHQRQKLWNNPTTKVFICTYATFLADMGQRARSRGRIAPDWASAPEFMICDEYHRVLRNKGSETFKLMKGLNPKRLVLSSGSAANKGPHSMWAALHLCAPKVFSSYWKYVNTFCMVDETPFGKQIVGVKNVQGWRNSISPYVFHRKKDLKDYPRKTRQTLDVEMEPWQEKIHKDLKKRLLTILESGDLVLVKNTLEATIRIRQMMICPKFIDPSLGYGAGLEAILEDSVTSELTHFVISTPFTGPIPYINSFFQTKGLHAFSLQGGMGPDEVDAEIAAWTKYGGVMVQSINFAESYELPAARIMYMLGYEHDPERNTQAEDRIHRDIRVTPHPVDIYYVKHLNSYDEKVIEALAMHADNVHELMNMPIREVFNL